MGFNFENRVLRQRTQSSSTDKGTPSRPVLAQKILQQSREAESALLDALVSIYYSNWYKMCQI